MVLATLATIIASQAIITGAFSLTRQAMQLGWFPGVHIHQTSADEYGQIYVPFVNWTMMLGTLALTCGFGSSERLAGAYGTAVSTTMLLTTALLYNAMRDIWRWPLLVALLVSGIFLSVDGAFFAANLLKMPEGGWIPLLFGARCLHHHDDLAQGHARRRRQARGRRGRSGRLLRRAQERPHCPRAGDRGVPHPYRRPDSAACCSITSPRSRRFRKRS